MKIALSQGMTIVISEEEYNFEEVLEAIKCSSRVFLATYNLAYNTKTSEIIKKIKDSNAETIVVSNIPEYKQKIDNKKKHRHIRDIMILLWMILDLSIILICKIMRKLL
ncbi:hypothetical protein [Bacillus pretiosus]|uniref:hypothetical protein n=1 Tax=Bacillus pretiosus TaxID=2983392 RepID=UPI003D65EA6A